VLGGQGRRGGSRGGGGRGGGGHWRRRLGQRYVKATPLHRAGALAGVHVIDPVRPEPLPPVLKPYLHRPGGHPKLLGQLRPDRGAGHGVLVECPPEDLHLGVVGSGAHLVTAAGVIRTGGARRRRGVVVILQVRVVRGNSPATSCRN